MLLDADDSQLVLVDYQARLMPAIHESEAVLRNALRLGRLAQLLEVPAWGTEQNPDELGQNPAELRALCRKTLVKMHFSGVADGLTDLLRAPARPRKAATRAACPSTCKKRPNPRSSATPSWWPAARRTSACCRRPWTCWRRNSTSGW